MNVLKNSTPTQIRQQIAQGQEQIQLWNVGAVDKGAAWGTTIYNDFLRCYNDGTKDAKFVVCFGLWLGLESELAEGSIEGLLYGLARVKILTNIERKACWKSVKDGLKQGTRNEPRVKNACNSNDCDDIVSKIPLDWIHATETICCIYLSIECGARSSSVCHVKKEHITVLPSGETRVVFVFGKGRRSWNHRVTLSTKSNAAKWLAKLKGDIQVSPDALNLRFQKCCENAGYPKVRVLYCYSVRHMLCVLR